MNRIYQEQLLDHYRSSRFRGILERPDFAFDTHNPSCGDRVVMQGRVVEGKLAEVRFEGAGCVISQATASMLAQAVTEKTLDDVQKMTVEDLVLLVGVPLGPVRLKCALLALEALHAGIASYRKNHA